jgi:hypothetical protein
MLTYLCTAEVMVGKDSFGCPFFIQSIYLVAAGGETIVCFLDLAR